jgi:hypothetical protein
MMQELKPIRKFCNHLLKVNFMYLFILFTNFFNNIRFFLAVQSSICKYNTHCDGKAKLRRMIKNAGQSEEYFIGCDKWIRGQKWHRYFKVNQEEIDLELLRNLFQGRNVCIF